MPIEPTESAKVEPKPGPPKKAKMAGILDACEILSAKLDASEKPAELWKAMDALYLEISDATQEEQDHIRALSARFHHYVPRS